MMSQSAFVLPFMDLNSPRCSIIMSPIASPGSVDQNGMGQYSPNESPFHRQGHKARTMRRSSSRLRGEISGFLPEALKKRTPEGALYSQTTDQVRPNFSTQAFSVICSKPWPLQPFLPLHPLMDVLHSLLPLQAL